MRKYFDDNTIITALSHNRLPNFTNEPPVLTIVKQDSRKIHPTALLVVKERTNSVAASAVKRILSHELETLPINLGNSRIGKITGVLVDTRFASINKVILEKAMQIGDLNILELASGYSFRIFENLPAKEIIISDLPSSISEISKIYDYIISENKIHRPAVYANFVGVDVLTDKLIEKVKFKSRNPVSIITEGLLPYLNRSQLETLTLSIKDYFRQSQKGSHWIATDLIFTDVLQSLNGDKVIDKVSQSTGTNLNKNSFDSLNEFVYFMSQLGMKVEARRLNDDKSYLQFSSYKRLLEKESVEDLELINFVLNELHVLVITPMV